MCEKFYLFNFLYFQTFAFLAFITIGQSIRVPVEHEASTLFHPYSSPGLQTYASPVIAKASSVYANDAVYSHVSSPAYAKVAAPVYAKIAAPVYAKTVVAEPVAPPHYDFEYGVHDPNTGDVKSQKESRHEDVVHGSYSLVEPDGTRRTVEYAADDHHGFRAVVHKEPAHVAVKTVAPIVAQYAAPVHNHGASVYKHVAPVYEQPAPVYQHSFPIYQQSSPNYQHNSLGYQHNQPAYAAQVYQQKVYKSAAPVYAGPLVTKTAVPAYTEAIVRPFHH